MGKWLLVGETRKSLRRWWTVLGGILFVLIFLQTVFGQYHGIEALAWGWMAIGLFPGLALVHLSGWLNRNPAKLVAPDTVFALRTLSVAYLLMLLATIFFSQAAVDSMGLGLNAYLRKSLLWVLPSNLLVSTGLGLLFFFQKSLRSPNPRIIQEIARSRSELAAAKGHSLGRQCMELVAGDDLGKALELLWTHCTEKEATDDLNAVILLRNQFSRITSEQDLNLVSGEEAQRVVNRIAVGILNLASELSA